MIKKDITNYAFFGSSRFSIIVLEEMKRLGFSPNLIVTTRDKPQGRKLIVTPNVVKVWANENGVEVLSPEKLDASFIENLKSICVSKNIETFIVASYGKIIPESVLDIPKHKTLNIHPSLLPQYRGASPLQTAILDDNKNTGVTIMRIDGEMDHGPIVAQKVTPISVWPKYDDFEAFMAREGAKLLVETIPGWVNGEIREVGQDHTKASYTKKISKGDAEIDLTKDAYENFRKIQAYNTWPVAFFFFDDGKSKIRVKIVDAEYDAKNNSLIINKVIPEGSREMSYQDFLKGHQKN